MGPRGLGWAVLQVSPQPTALQVCCRAAPEGNWRQFSKWKTASAHSKREWQRPCLSTVGSSQDPRSRQESDPHKWSPAAGPWGQAPAVTPNSVTAQFSNGQPESAAVLRRSTGALVRRAQATSSRGLLIALGAASGGQDEGFSPQPLQHGVQRRKATGKSGGTRAYSLACRTTWAPGMEALEKGSCQNSQPPSHRRLEARRLVPSKGLSGTRRLVPGPSMKCTPTHTHPAGGLLGKMELAQGRASC